MARRKDVYVSRKVGKYRVGMWLPLKNLIGLGFLIFLGLAFYGIFLGQNRAASNKEFESFPPLVDIAPYTCTEDRDRMPDGLKSYSRRCWSSQRNARGDIRYRAVGDDVIIKAKP
ncbi:hypothetical protein GA0061099_1004446 [Bradyrhizobium yuanmingense]|uniref:Uncharacterized protein n=1 Tax=Bradyrhizobium yuanmingense TaxID=108015 RepID=A0A1C3VRC2_9BRAD|nr:hypothetical protein [Bradyrhizobium yuanmingense]TWI28858.1 hypothetical protein IQ15_02205 [Bradyrhizobium yuanmingense]SCB30312.1 hypothetical protein GA0061099_1004446 [Bradyrhizobium yuanmingense]